MQRNAKHTPHELHEDAVAMCNKQAGHWAVDEVSMVNLFNENAGWLLLCLPKLRINSGFMPLDRHCLHALPVHIGVHPCPDTKELVCVV